MEREMNIFEIFQVIKKRISILIAIVLSFVVLGAGVSFLINEKVYSSTATLIVGTEQTRDTDEINEITGEPIKETYISYGTHGIYEESINFYNDILKSDTFLEHVVTTLDLNLSKEELRNGISLKTDDKSGSMEITISGKNFKNADEITNKVVNEFINENFEITNLDNIQIMDQASNPKVENTANFTKNIILAFVAGTVLGIIIIIIIEYFDNTIQSTEEITKSLDLRLLGQINEESKTEDLKNIRTQLLYDSKLKNKKVIALADFNKNSESYIVDFVNTIVQLGYKTLLIDADLRDPSIHRKLDLSNETGLSNILNGKLLLNDVVQQESTNTNYHVLTAGDSLSNPSEKLSSKLMKNILGENRDNYNYILINGHSLGNVTDSIVLAKQTDGIILFVELGKTMKKEVREVKELLQSLEVPILGVIIK